MFKRLITAEQEKCPNIPLFIINELLHIACKDVFSFCKCKFLAPPKHIKSWSIMRESETSIDDFHAVLDADNINNIYEIWSLTLDNNQHVYILLAAEYIKRPFKQGKWQNETYLGFFDTISAARNHLMKIKE